MQKLTIRVGPSGFNYHQSITRVCISLISSLLGGRNSLGYKPASRRAIGRYQPISTNDYTKNSPNGATTTFWTYLCRTTAKEAALILPCTVCWLLQTPLNHKSKASEQKLDINYVTWTRPLNGHSTFNFFGLFSTKLPCLTSALESCLVDTSVFKF